ncbi:hypothetical protein Tco_0741313 [Tanacetum coccineum]
MTLLDILGCPISRELDYGITDEWDGLVEAIEEIAPTTIEGVNRNITDLSTTFDQETTIMHGLMEDARDDRSELRGRVNLLYRDRPIHHHLAVMVEREAWMAREAWGFSMDVRERMHVTCFGIVTIVVEQRATDTDGWFQKQQDQQKVRTADCTRGGWSTPIGTTTVPLRSPYAQRQANDRRRCYGCIAARLITTRNVMIAILREALREFVGLTRWFERWSLCAVLEIDNRLVNSCIAMGNTEEKELTDKYLPEGRGIKKIEDKTKAYVERFFFLADTKKSDDSALEQPISKQNKRENGRAYGRQGMLTGEIHSLKNANPGANSGGNGCLNVVSGTCQEGWSDQWKINNNGVIGMKCQGSDKVYAMWENTGANRTTMSLRQITATKDEDKSRGSDLKACQNVRDIPEVFSRGLAGFTTLDKWNLESICPIRQEERWFFPDVYRLQRIEQIDGKEPLPTPKD